MSTAGGTAAALQQVCDALQLPISSAQRTLLTRYLDALQQWNATYNLTAVRDRGAMLTQHLADCLAVVRPIQRGLAQHAVPRLLDVGSGGGLPGVVLAVMIPALQVTCVDAVGKKMAFVRQVAGTLALGNLHVRHARVETLAMPVSSVITSRAFSSLADFVALTEHQLSSDGVWVAMKGRVPEDEITGLPPSVQMFHVEQLQVPDLHADRCLVWMRRHHDADQPMASAAHARHL